MQIIKKGHLPEHQMRCDFCGCEFTFDINDIHENSDDLNYHLNCPQCHNEIPVCWWKWNAYVREKRGW